jgi:N-acetylglucosamine-6-phosphate deacetylase
MKSSFVNGKVLFGESFIQNGFVTVENGKILNCGAGMPEVDGNLIDVEGAYVVPGFIDLQVNGGAGEFFTNNISKEALKKIFNAHLEYGTTSYLPTLISTTLENIFKAVDVVKDIMSDPSYGSLGIHVEGPFFNVEKKGAHFEKFIHAPSDEEIDQIAKKGQGVIKLLTLAPEVVKDHQIRTLIDAGIKISAGHSNATYEEAKHGFAMGIGKVTHLYNAMSQLNSRNPGLVGAALDTDTVYAGIITDGVHVAHASVKVAHKLKKDRLFLVSDASFVKHPMKEFEMDGFKVHYEDGKYLTDDGKLAGSSITMLEGVQNCVLHGGIPLADAIRMASVIPARYMGINNQRGVIKPGNIADLLVLDHNLNLKHTMLSGEFINETKVL